MMDGQKGPVKAAPARFVLLVGVFFAASFAYFALFESSDLSVETTIFLSKEIETLIDSGDPEDEDDPDADCIFRHSKLYRKVYVYPSPNEPEWSNNETASFVLTDAGRSFQNNAWPWLEIDARARAAATAHYNIESDKVQYASELLVRELFVNPNSCLRTYDPESADLFYVPYLPSTEHHTGDDTNVNMRRSPFGMAILQILNEQKYEQWENRFGLTSKYWKRRGGSDHILVFSEPMHGLWHPPKKRGHYHFIHTQKQLAPPIVFSVELSTPFVQQYPNCAKKNILLPYPNTHGGWFNGHFGQSDRNISQYYSAGMHGSCEVLRKAMKKDYTSCAPSFRQLTDQDAMANTGGDSPSAKRMFDSLIAGCIPVILSKEFVWPFTKEFDATLDLDPSKFSVRLPAAEYESPLLDPDTCDPLDPQKPGLQAYLDSIPPEQIQRLLDGAAEAGKLYSWYKENPDLPLNPLKERVLPDGGTAHFVVRALEERAAGKLWPACRDELAAMPAERDEPGKFHC